MPGILGGPVSILAAAVTKNPELSTGEAARVVVQW